MLINGLQTIIRMRDGEKLNIPLGNYYYYYDVGRFVLRFVFDLNVFLANPLERQIKNVQRFDFNIYLSTASTAPDCNQFKIFKKCIYV